MKDATVTFSAPGRDGALPPESNVWRKGLVYTTRCPNSLAIDHDYRATIGVKCGLGAWSPRLGFSRPYHRVRHVAPALIAGKRCADSEEVPSAFVAGHAWGGFGPGDSIGTALVVVGFQCPGQSQFQQDNLAMPTEAQLLQKGGASMEELSVLAPQRANEIYNEFDFTEPADRGPITLSYGEPISGLDVDFEPIVRRAERMAADYRSLLCTFGEAHTDTFRVVHREWFFASTDFATVHICFDR